MLWRKDLALYGGVAALITGAVFASSALTVPAAPSDVPRRVVSSPRDDVPSLPSSSGVQDTGLVSMWSHGLLLGRLVQRTALPTGSVPPASPSGPQPTPVPTALASAGPLQDAPRVVATSASTPAAAITSVLGSTVPSAVRRWEPLILKYAAAYGLDPNLIAAIIMTESAGNPSALSQHGAVGLMQVKGGSYDPETNIQQGAQILADYLQRFGGDLELGLAAYNAGPNAVTQAGGIPPYLETQTYIFRVLNRYYLYSPS